MTPRDPFTRPCCRTIRYKTPYGSCNSILRSYQLYLPHALTAALWVSPQNPHSIDLGRPTCDRASSACLPVSRPACSSSRTAASCARQRRTSARSLSDGCSGTLELQETGIQILINNH